MYKIINLCIVLHYLIGTVLIQHKTAARRSLKTYQISDSVTNDKDWNWIWKRKMIFRTGNVYISRDLTVFLLLYFTCSLTVKKDILKMNNC